MDPNTHDVTIQQAFAALWPILTACCGGYLALLGIIWKMMNDRLAELQERNRALQAEVKAFQGPLGSIADTSEEMNRTLREVLDGILPRGPRGRGQ